MIVCYTVNKNRKEVEHMLLRGCREGKIVPRIKKVRCPQCGQWLEIFVTARPVPGKGDILVEDERCECGCLLPAGSCEKDYWI